MFSSFSLTLMVTHACNLQCDYCYVGAKSQRTMDAATGRIAIERAVSSISPGGTLELGFFGGEPLLEAELIGELAAFASETCRRHAICLDLQLTTNGTITSEAAWAILSNPAIRIHLSHDGLPEVHDRHRHTADGQGTSSRVLETFARLGTVRDDVGVVMVVRPDSADVLAEGIRFLRSHGVFHVTPSLDLWAVWTPGDATRLAQALGHCADAWREGLPQCSIGWFDEKAARLAGLPMKPTARCGFGQSELAVAPSGSLYPCERLIGEDAADNPMRLPGRVQEGGVFPSMPAPPRSDEACSACKIAAQCSTTCRCANYVRTGDVQRPDGLLCLLDRTCLQETARILGSLPIVHRCEDAFWENVN